MTSNTSTPAPKQHLSPNTTRPQTAQAHVNAHVLLHYNEFTEELVMVCRVSVPKAVKPDDGP
jgi:hypothetical protein